MASDTGHIRLISSLPANQLLVQRVRATEELGRLFSLELELLSPDPHLKVEDLLGDKMTVELELPDGERYWNGHVARFGQAGAFGRHTRYHATLVPFLWLLTRSSDSRIFKKSTVPDIVKEVVGKSGLGQVEEKLQTGYLPREYVVQYRESHFDFLSRLMEEEGIYYFFRHEKNQHVMVLCDDRSSHKTVPGFEKLPYIDPEVNAAPREDHFGEWTVAQQVVTGAYAVNDFDFEVPKADLLAKSSRPLKHKHSGLEHYDPFAGYVDALDAGNDGDPHRGDRGDLFARVRLEEQQAEHDRTVGRSNARGLHAGSLFELSRHPRDDQNRELLVVRAEYSMFRPGIDAGSSAGRTAVQSAADALKGTGAQLPEEPAFEARYTVQPSKIPFRPQRVTPRPVLAGPHSAIVMGSGEIWTDKFARVKVHFPWDRDDTEGCWVRVSQPWAGAGWGGLYVPRVGQEVIVEFMEGDPDRPIITGRVYNGTNLPPFGLPDGATHSGVLTRSTSGGSADTANELRFQDKKGEEQVFIHAEKNMDTEVENDQTLLVEHDRKKTVKNDQSEEVDGNKTIKVAKDHTESIAQNMALRVGKDEDEQIGGGRTITVGGDHTENVKGKQGVTVGGDGAWSVGGKGAITFGGTGAFSIGGDHTEDVGGKLSFSVAEDASVGVGKNTNLEVGQNLGVNVGQGLTLSVSKDANVTVDGTHKLTVGKKIGIEAQQSILVESGDSITLKSGSASITLKSGGDVEIKGSKITLKADGDIVLKGAKIGQN